MLFDLRNKLFAHKDANLGQFLVPPINELDQFFKNLISLYNELTATFDDFSTIFINAEEVKHDLEYLFMNLYRGENVQKQEINIDWLWEKDSGKISDVISNITE